ncbi:Protein indeterminate-domain 2 [Dichanthelium oligosanthes]|uniref:Protein indeterminate-domain 2 n=1 Tax=Dichanthelium oligosanthes TaxID=888268 RepID=A0A1E5VCE4_9POAL|nr:Protein indeterminate-domain 2 [Dichanthelium oligosanthes]
MRAPFLHQEVFHLLWLRLVSLILVGWLSALTTPMDATRETKDPGAEVIALSPRTLVATNRFVCEICNKGFQRDQNLQLHRRGHNLPWKLRQRSLPSGAGRQGDGAPPRKRVYVCPEPTCVHHDPARALGDLTGIKKHFSRKHGEKRWRCERCGKRYAVQSDWKAHVKGCGTREYRCDCGILFTRYNTYCSCVLVCMHGAMDTLISHEQALPDQEPRSCPGLLGFLLFLKDSLLTHRAFCDALAEESARLLAAANNSSTITTNSSNGNSSSITTPLFLPFPNNPPLAAAQNPNAIYFLHQEQAPPFLQPRMMQPSPYLDLHAGATFTTAGGGIVTDTVNFGLAPDGSVAMRAAGGGHRRLTRDFLGVDGGGQVEELQLQLYAATAAASCATDLTRQYLGERLPPVSETWSHNF